MGSEDEDLVPVFVPFLAQVLALYEKEKGGPLTEIEVTEITGKATCIMVRRSDAEMMRNPFRDVNPADCWVDWHRVRSEVVDSYVPIIVLTVLATSGSLSRLRAILGDDAIEYSVREQLKDAVEMFAGKASTAFPQSDLENIARHECSIEIKSKGFTARQAPQEAFNCLQLIRRLLDCNAIAVCCDSSYITHSKENWIKLADNADKDFELNGLSGGQLGAALCSAYMQYPVDGDKDLFTCGLHLLGQADLIVAKDTLASLLKKKDGLVKEARGLFWALAIYLLTECEGGKFASGNTFSVSADGPRFRAIWEPCSYFQETDIRYNHYGLWRLMDAKEGRKR